MLLDVNEVVREMLVLLHHEAQHHSVMTADRVGGGICLRCLPIGCIFIRSRIRRLNGFEAMETPGREIDHQGDQDC